MKLISYILLLVLYLIDFAGKSSENSTSVYLHTDRSYYLPGEKISFKAYLFDPGKNSDPARDSLFVALYDQEGLEISTGSFPLNNSQIKGSIELPVTLTDGEYILFAFTRSMAGCTPDKYFSRIIGVRNSYDIYLLTDVHLTDTLYKPGEMLKAQISFTGKGNKPVSSNYNYRLTNKSNELLAGKMKTGEDGVSTLSLRLPDFDQNETTLLSIYTAYKGTKCSTGIIIPTNKHHNAGEVRTAIASQDYKKLNIRIETVPVSGKVQLNIFTTDEKGNPVMANLSVSASNLMTGQGDPQNDILMYNSDYKQDGSVLKTDAEINNYFVNKLQMVSMRPGKAFLLQEKNNSKKLYKKRKADNSLKQEGYSSDRNIFDVLQQIKPYHIDNGKITFGLRGVNSLVNQDGALIVINGIKMGSDASILNNIPITDVARITASTDVMEIQRYSALNNCGVIEIFMKNTKEDFDKEGNAISPKSHTLFWEPDIVTDKSGKASVTINNNSKSASVLISVAGAAQNGIFGVSSLKYKFE